ncbi:MAG: hypothetical protein IJK04_16490, partial [Kiritimatiellae bacterium]|nr:hypothetical protein [Kiritimatiellia bacterium]
MSDAPPKQPVKGTDSVRMDTGSSLPPYQGANTDADPVPVTPASSGASAGMSASAALVSMHNAASQGDAFPVLKAFQDYLESERQRARRRMTTLSVVFAVVIVVVIGAFTLIWFSTMHGMQDTNRQLLDAALKRANADPPAPVVVQPPPQPSAAETAKIIAEAVSKAQSEQSATFAKTLEGLNASLESMRRDNAEMRAEIEREKAAAAKAEAEKAAAQKAAAERAAAEEKAKAAKAEAQKVPARKVAAGQATHAQAATGGPGAVPAAAATPPAELVIPKYNAPPSPEGFSQDVMAVRLQKEP